MLKTVSSVFYRSQTLLGAAIWPVQSTVVAAMEKLIATIFKQKTKIQYSYFVSFFGQGTFIISNFI